MYELEAAGQHYCEDEWDKQKYHHNIVEDSVLVKYCFSSAYMVALLHDNLGIPMDDKRYVVLSGLARTVVILLCLPILDLASLSYVNGIFSLHLNNLM